MIYKRIMFFGGCFGKGLKPVGVVAGTVVDSPFFHAFGNTVCHFAGQRFLVVNGIAQRLISFCGEVFKHLLTIEHILAVILFGSFCRYLYRVCLAVEGFIDYFKSQLRHKR